MGTAFQKPNWRYDALRNPETYNLSGFLSSKKGKNPGYLKKLITKNIAYTVHYIYPKFFRSISKDLPQHLQDRLFKIWYKKFNKEGKPRIEFTEPKKYQKLPSWNIKKLPKVKDEWLRKLVAHVLNYKFDDSIAFAMKMQLDPAFSAAKRFMGFCFFANIPDKDIGNMWGIKSTKHIEAVRMLFFDFSKVPEDAIAKWSILRQWVDSKDITEEEYKYYKRVFDLGKLGLKAQTAFYHLDDLEQKQINQYLGRTAASNAFNIDFCINSTNEAMNYNKMIGDIARNELLRITSTQQSELLKLSIQAKQKEMTDDSLNIQIEDEKLFGIVKEISKYNAEPKYIDFVDLKKAELK